MPAWPIEGVFCLFVFLPFYKNRNFAKFGCARGAGSVTPSVTPCQPPAALEFCDFWQLIRQAIILATILVKYSNQRCKKKTLFIRRRSVDAAVHALSVRLTGRRLICAFSFCVSFLRCESRLDGAVKPHYRDRPVNASVCELSVMGADYFAFCLPCYVCSVGGALVLSSGVFVLL